MTEFREATRSLTSVIAAGRGCATRFVDALAPSWPRILSGISAGRGATGVCRCSGSLLRFALTNGVVSLTGNLAVMATLVSGAHVAPIFWLGEAFVFEGDRRGSSRVSRGD